LGRARRIRLTEAAVRALPYSDNGQYIVRDEELAGFFVRVGRETKTYTVQADVRALGRRRTSKRKALGRHGEVNAREARALARRWLAEVSNGAGHSSTTLTLQQAWERYRESHLIRKCMATAGQKRERALAAIDREVRRAVSGLTRDELDRVKVSYLASLNRFDRTAARRSNRLATWWSLGLAPERRARLERVIGTTTLDEVNRVVADVLDPDRYYFAEAGAVPE
jgi:hypothetical protein